MNEARYQNELIKRIKALFKNCIVLKNNPDHIQGIPDLLVLHGRRWAALEVKVAEDSDEQPNQRHYVEKMNRMSFASFICPATEKVVLDELQQALTPRRKARVPQP